MIEQDAYKNVLQRAGWALPRPFLYIHKLFFPQIKNTFTVSVCMSMWGGGYCMHAAASYHMNVNRKLPVQMSAGLTPLLDEGFMAFLIPSR
jgi:hypothetical protein